MLPLNDFWFRLDAKPDRENSTSYPKKYLTEYKLNLKKMECPEVVMEDFKIFRQSYLRRVD